MASILKGQILKHLTKFFKNLSPDKLHLSALKGSCELHNLELNEACLMEMMEFPVWLNLAKATCNQLIIRISWTKLKTVPIHFSLDEVVVDIETCEEFRTNQDKHQVGHNGSAGSKYGFADRVIDGISISINSVIINFKSSAFKASFQLSLLTVESRTPQFKRGNDLRITRIKDQTRGQILLFKHIEWQTLKLEAKSETFALSAPLRLITSQGYCRITMKKRLTDCMVLSARIVIIFDDLLWVLTDAMLLSAFHLATYLNGLISRSPITKTVIEENTSKSGGLGKGPHLSQAQLQTPVARLFSQFDVIETSHHLFIARLQLQLCDDLDPVTSRSSYPPLLDGGALHVIVNKLVMDYYPYHKAFDTREHWLKYYDPSSTREDWLKKHLELFVESLSAPLKAGECMKPANRSQIESKLKDLLSVVTLIRVGDYSVNCVSTATSASGKSRKFTSKDFEERKFISTCPFPDDLPALYCEINNFYYYELGSLRNSAAKKVPDPTTFVHVSPLKVLFDPTTILWINSFHSNLHKAMIRLKELIPDNADQIVMRTRVEMLLPVLSFDLKNSSESEPKSRSSEEFMSMEVKSTRVILTNESKETESLNKLNNLMALMAGSEFFYNREQFPWISGVDPKPVSDKFIEHVGHQSLSNRIQLFILKLDPLWVEFKSKKNVQKPEPFVDPLHLTLWVYLSEAFLDEKRSSPESAQSGPEADLSILLCIPSNVRVSLSHSKYLFLMRLFEQLDDFNDYMSADTLRYQTLVDQNPFVPRISISAVIPEVDVTLILKEEFNRHKTMGTSPMNESTGSLAERLKQFEDTLTSEAEAISPMLDGNPKTGDSSPNGSSVNISTSRSPQLLADDRPYNLAVGFHPKLVPTSGSAFKRVSLHSGVLDSGINSENVSCNVSDISPNDDDAKSIRSDMSAESDNYVMVQLDITPDEDIFELTHKKVEQGEEVTEHSISEASEDLSAIPSNPVSVNFLQVKISSVAFVKQTHGFHSSLLLNCRDISVKEFIRMAYSDYNLYWNSKSKRSSIDSSASAELAPKKASAVSLRLDAVSRPGSKADLVSLDVKGVTVDLNMDTMKDLSDFVLDPDIEIIGPVNVWLRDVSVKLTDDLVKTVPMLVDISGALVCRNKDNVVTFKPIKDFEVNLVPAHVDLLNAHLNTSYSYKHESASNGRPEEDLVNQLLRENELMTREMESLRRQNEMLRKRVADE